MKIAEMNNCIEKMREIYKFDDEKTKIEIGRFQSEADNSLVRLETVDKSGIQVVMVGRTDGKCDEDFDWTKFYEFEDC